MISNRIWAVYLNKYPLEFKTSIEDMKRYLVNETNWLTESQFEQLKNNSVFVGVKTFSKEDIFDLVEYEIVGENE